MPTWKYVIETDLGWLSGILIGGNADSPRAESERAGGNERRRDMIYLTREI